MMNLTKTGFDEKEYEIMAGEIDLLRERVRGVKMKETESGVRAKWVQELLDYLMGQRGEIKKFDEKIFRRFVEKVRVCSMVEVEFILKAGIEVMELL